MIFIGVDPGLTGALSAIDHNGIVLGVYDLPTRRVEIAGMHALVKRKIDALALRKIIMSAVPSNDKAILVIEDMQLLGGHAIQTMGSLAHTRGVIEAVAMLCGMDVRFVTPREWKASYGFGADKKIALRIARELYPGAPIKLAKHHNRAESLLISRWAFLKLS